jgi:methionyl-tRNA formyltransferase
MGSPAFATPSLRGLVDAGYDVAAVVTQPDRPAGRGGATHAPDIKRAALDLGIDVILQPETLRDDAVCHALAALEPDVFVVAAYGKILPKSVLAIPRRGSLNVHASLLPRWRGASPIAAAILAGDRETGVCIMELVAKMDAGPIVSCARAPIGLADTTGSLELRLAELGARVLLEALPGWLDGSLPATPQDEGFATYCRTLAKDDGWLRAAMTAAEAERAVRAYNPWPGAFVQYRGQRLALWAAHLAQGAPGGVVGSLSTVGRLPSIAFAGGLLVLDEVQKPGGRRLTGQEFLNGERGRLESAVVLA